MNADPQVMEYFSQTYSNEVSALGPERVRLHIRPHVLYRLSQAEYRQQTGAGA